MIGFSQKKIRNLFVKSFSKQLYCGDTLSILCVKIFEVNCANILGNPNEITNNSPLRKIVIAWERSRAASGYGIVWGTQIETNKRNLVRNVIAWFGFNKTTDSNKIEVIVLDDQKSRELRRIRTTGLAVYLDDCTIV